MSAAQPPEPLTVREGAAVELDAHQRRIVAELGRPMAERTRWLFVIARALIAEWQAIRIQCDATCRRADALAADVDALRIELAQARAALSAHLRTAGTP